MATREREAINVPNYHSNVVLKKLTIPHEVWRGGRMLIRYDFISVEEALDHGVNFAKPIRTIFPNANVRDADQSVFSYMILQPSMIEYAKEVLRYYINNGMVKTLDIRTALENATRVDDSELIGMLRSHLPSPVSFWDGYF